MITPVDTEFAGGIWIFTLLNIFDVGAIDTNRNIMFRFTGNGTSMTTNTSSVIYYKAIIYHFFHSTIR